MNRNFSRMVLISVSSVYAIISSTVATSVVLTIEGIGYRLSFFSFVLYIVIMASDAAILALGTMKFLTLLRKLESYSVRETVVIGQAPSNPSVPVLTEKEQLLIHAIQRDGGKSMQNTLVQVTGLSSPTVSRLISSLEQKGIVEKRRKGMTNEVILKIVR